MTYSHQPVTFHTFDSCKTWPSYQAAYLNWMKRVNHPDLRASNYNASTWKERNLTKPVAPP